MNRTPKHGSMWLRLLPLFLVLAAVLIYYSWNRMSRQDEEAGPTPPVEVSEESGEPEQGPPLTELERRWQEVTGSPPAWPTDFADPKDCEAVMERLEAMCRKLDERSYVKSWQLPGGVFGLLKETADVLESRTPPVDGILSNIDRIRANLVHLFRVLGRKRLVRLVELIREEPEFAEPFALNAYQWLRMGERCEDPRPSPPGLDEQYEYAVFSLSTPGGHAYLRRRAPRLEALASFYALLVVDAAIQRDHNPHGIDPRKEIARLKELMEGQRLVFQAEYLRILGELEARWKGARLP